MLTVYNKHIKRVYRQNGFSLSLLLKNNRQREEDVGRLFFSALLFFAVEYNISKGDNAGQHGDE